MIAARRRTMELMDQPELDPNLHVAALHGLRRINSISRSAAILWPSIAEAASELQQAPLHVLDLACGMPDLPVDADPASAEYRDGNLPGHDSWQPALSAAWPPIGYAIHFSDKLSHFTIGG
jgi:hypothetical protein